MTSDRTPNVRSASTRWAQRTVKISTARREARQSTAKPFRFVGLRPWPRFERLTLSIQYRGGAECYYLIGARGRHAIFSGSTSLHDAMCEITQSL